MMGDVIGRLTVRRAAWIAGLAGTIGPTAFVIADLLISEPSDARRYRWLWDMLERLAPIVWPTQLLMLMTHRREHTAFGYAVFGISLVANVILFAIVGAVCWIVLRSLVRAVQGRR
jgi:hypothetical protein